MCGSKQRMFKFFRMSVYSRFYMPVHVWTLKKYRCRGDIVDSHIVDRKFRKHFEFEILLLGDILHAYLYTCTFDQSYCNRRLRHIALDKYSKTNFSYFSIPAPSILDHASRRSATREPADNAIHPARHLHQKIDQPPSVAHNCEHHENLTGRIHWKRTTLAIDTYPARSRTRPSTSS